MGTKSQNISARELLILARKTAAIAIDEVACSPSRRLKLCVDVRYNQRGGFFLLTHANTGVSKEIVKIVKGTRRLSTRPADLTSLGHSGPRDEQDGPKQWQRKN